MAAHLPRHWILAFVLLGLIVGIWSLRRRPQQYPSAYVSDVAATLWSSTAVVRQPVATLGYGQRVAVLRRVADQAEVRTDDGSIGWLDARVLMDPALWQQAAALLARARALPVQAIGHTRAFSNVHLEPGRQSPRIFQFARDVPVAVFERKLVSAANANNDSPPEGASEPEDQQPKDEDWLFVMRREDTGATPAGSASVPSSSVVSEHTDTGAAIPIAGWVLAQFVALDPPQPIPDYAGASGLSVVAWVPLDPAADPDGEKPQYLVAGVHGEESRTCDFNALRVYTWGAGQKRYETAYVENDLCGQLPIRVRKTPEGTEFSFAEIDQNNQERVYRMKQTTVRLISSDGSPKGR